MRNRTFRLSVEPQSKLEIKRTNTNAALSEEAAGECSIVFEPSSSGERIEFYFTDLTSAGEWLRLSSCFDRGAI